MAGPGYSEEFFHDFEIGSAATTAGGRNLKFWRNVIYGTAGSTLYPLISDTSGYLYAQAPLPGAGAGNIPMSVYYMSGYLTTMTKNGKTKYFTYDTNNKLSGVSAWL